jgi:RluA family pseudouridine synthase
MSIDIESTILFEDEVLLVINKPCGLMVEPDRNGHPNLLQEVKKYLKEKLCVDSYAQHIHRLDRPVSGIVLFAKSKSVLKNLSEQFAERRVKKLYKALTENEPNLTEGIITHWHRKEKKKAVLYNEQIEFSELAQLQYKTVRLSDQLVEWDIELETGKYHQIRAQLANLGCPIIGDAMYGSIKDYISNSIALHARLLEFHHPLTNKKISIGCASNWNG